MSKALAFFVQQMHYRSMDCSASLNALIEARNLNKDVLKREKEYNAEFAKLKHYSTIVVELETLERIVESECRNRK